jgi:hypothetical protein
MTGDHQSNHMTGGPAQAKLCCYDGWLRPQICTEEKVTFSARKLPCINKRIASQEVSIHKLGISLTLLFKLNEILASKLVIPFSFREFTRQKQHGMTMAGLAAFHILTIATFL